jgi:hypothetical protein
VAVHKQLTIRGVIRTMTGQGGMDKSGRYVHWVARHDGNGDQMDQTKEEQVGATGLSADISTAGPVCSAHRKMIP